jgi:hypothetical protein
MCGATGDDLKETSFQEGSGYACRGTRGECASTKLCIRDVGPCKSLQRGDCAAQNHLDAADTDKICRAYGNHFYEAVVTRQTASLCEDSGNRQRNLELLDAEIDAFNRLIAKQCIGL